VSYPVAGPSSSPYCEPSKPPAPSSAKPSQQARWSVAARGVALDPAAAIGTSSSSGSNTHHAGQLRAHTAAIASSAKWATDAEVCSQQEQHGQKRIAIDNNQSTGESSSLRAASQISSNSISSRGRPSLDSKRRPTISSGGSTSQASMSVGGSGEGSRAMEGHMQSKLRAAPRGAADPGASTRGGHEDADGAESTKAVK
jgi:hypothetical protein